jgi:hypothetical protein
MTGHKSTTASRTTSVVFAVFWLGILTVFSFGSYYANALAVYSLLALMVGIRAACMVRQDVPRSVSAVLAYAGALHFGVMGGLTVGITAGIGVGVSSRSARPALSILKNGMQAGVAGLAAGLMRENLLHGAAPAWYDSISSTLGPAVACLFVLLIGELVAGYKRNWALSNRRMHGNRIAV